MPHNWLAKPAVVGPLHAWLTASGSLSWRIQARCPAFGVTRIFQGRKCPYADEAALVGLLPGKTGLIREVVLSCGDVPVVVAHSAARPEDLAGPWRSLS